MSNKFEAFFKSFADTEEQLDFRLAHEEVAEKTPVIRTGSIALDDALSAGGLPKGRLIQYYGTSGSGKTLCAMLAMKNAQLDDPDAFQVFIDAEGTFDSKWATSLGVDTSKVYLVEGDTAVNGRKCFEMILGVPKEDAKTHVLKGKSKEGLLDKIMKKELNINLIVLDSLGAIIPPGEDTAAVGKMNMALLARFLTPTFKKLSLEVNKAKVPFIIINHKRDNMDPYGVDHTYSGGNTYTHFLSANVYFTIVGGKDSIIFDEKENKVGHTLRASVEKSKFGTTKKCEFKVNFGFGVVNEEENIAQLAIDYDVISKPSSVTHEYKDRKWVGFGKFCEAIAEDKELAAELVLKIDEAREHRMDKKREEQRQLKEKSVGLKLATELDEDKKSAKTKVTKA